MDHTYNNLQKAAVSRITADQVGFRLQCITRDESHKYHTQLKGPIQQEDASILNRHATNNS